MKSYTDLEQSKKLAEILPRESADMYYCYGMDIHTKKWEYDTVPTIIDADNQIDIGDIPCWSLAALIEILPENIHIKDWENYIICIDKDSICYKRKEDVLSQAILHESQSTNLVDACVEMIIFLNESKML
jgi:hypothetical protein